MFSRGFLRSDYQVESARIRPIYMRMGTKWAHMALPHRILAGVSQ